MVTVARSKTFNARGDNVISQENRVSECDMYMCIISHILLLACAYMFRSCHKTTMFSYIYPYYIPVLYTQHLAVVEESVRLGAYYGVDPKKLQV